MSELCRSSISTNYHSKQFAQEMQFAQETKEATQFMRLSCLDTTRLSLLIKTMIPKHKGTVVPQSPAQDGLKLNHSHTALISLLGQILAMD